MVTRYRAKGAVRDVGKALGLTEDVISALSTQIWGWSEHGISDEQLQALEFNTADRRLRLALELAAQLIGTPRHLSQHPGGFVLTQDRLDELVPIEPAAIADRAVIEWDKDDVDALKIMKVDVLGLGMLGCMRRAFEFLAAHKDVTLDLATIPAEDPRTYAMIRKADTVGVFQIESHTQMAMLPRIKPRTFYDLVIEVAIGRYLDCATANGAKDDKLVDVAGIVLMRQRPGSAKGVLFVTLEDETGIVNLIVWAKVFDENRRVILSAGMLGVRGYVQREGEVVHIIAVKVTDLSGMLCGVGDRARVTDLSGGPAYVAQTGPRPLSNDERGIRTRTRDFR